MKLPAALLFAAAAAVALWQSARVTVLWDLTYVLEIAYRITLGDVPYRDFVVPQTPLTFLLQAAIIRVFESGYFWHRVYCALVAGATAALTYRIIWFQFDGPFNARAPLYAFVIAAPTVFLNGYAILPLPFYDPDCSFFVLLALHAVLAARRRGAVWWRHVAAGILVILPLMAKQNIGLASLLGIHGFLLLSALRQRGESERRAYSYFLAGSLIGLFVVAASVHAWIGIPHLYQWTVSYAATRRWPSSTLMLSPYLQSGTWVTVACAFGGYHIARRRRASVLPLLLGLAVIALPLVAATRTILRWGLGARSFYFWGLASIAGSSVALLDWVKASWQFERAVPLIAVGVAHGAFASQGLYDSSYSVWPFLTIALAPLAARILGAAARTDLITVTAFVILLSGGLVWVGYRHVAHQERLGFVDLSGQVETATLSRIRGLATPGSYVSDFERLVRRCQELIPLQDAVLAFPGEDPFFFASGRRPLLPVVLFDDTAMPYNTAQLMQLLDEKDIKWVVLKDRLQLRHSPWALMETFLATDLPSRYEAVEVLPRYTILKRRSIHPTTAGAR